MPRTTKTNEQGQYWCPMCHTFKALSDFGPAPPSQRGIKAQYCKKCCLVMHYYNRQKQLIKKIGPEAYKEKLDSELAQLKKCYIILEKYMDKAQ